jgi:hypothetical protein
MKKKFNLKIQIIIIIFTTAVFALAGYFYNQKQPNKWYVKYSIDQTYFSKSNIKAMDETLSGISIFSSTTILSQFLDKKIYELPMYNENSYFKNLVINHDLLAFNTNGPLDNLDKNLNELVNILNQKLRAELTKYVKSLSNVNKNVGLYERELKIDDLTLSLEFYEKEGVDPAGVSEEALDMVNFLMSRDSNTVVDTNLLTKLSFILMKIKNNNSTKFMYLELEKLKKLGTKNMLEFKKIEKLLETLIKSEIIEIGNQMEVTNQKPLIIVTVITFTIFGFSISFLICTIILIFLRKINTKKLLTLLNPE